MSRHDHARFVHVIAHKFCSQDGCGVILKMTTDDPSGDASVGREQLRYLPVSKMSDFKGEKELLFTGRAKFKISNIYKVSATSKKGHRVEVAMLNNIQKLLQNGVPEWTKRDLALFDYYISDRKDTCGC